MDPTRTRQHAGGRAAHMLPTAAQRPLNGPIPDLCIFRKQPLMRIVAAHFSHRFSFCVFLFLCIFILPKVISSGIQGTLVNHSDVTSDIRELLSLSCQQPSTDPSVPFLR